MLLDYPKISKKRQLVRLLVDSAVAQIPILGGPLVSLYQLTHPPASQASIEDWMKQVTDILNTESDTPGKIETVLSDIYDSIDLSEKAFEVGAWIATKCESGGRYDIVRYEDIKEEFKVIDSDLLIEYVGELENYGAINTSHCIGKPLNFVTPNSSLFEIFDPLSEMKTNPREDAATIGKILLENGGNVSAEEVESNTGWEIRRLNPALSIIAEYIGRGRKSIPMGQDYVVRSMFANPSERAAIRKFIDSLHK